MVGRQGLAALEGWLACRRTIQTVARAGGESEERMNMSDKWIPHVEPKIKEKCVKIIAHIKRVSNGEIRKYETWDILGKSEFPSTSMWEQGNYGCDCNRHLFFGRAIGVEPENDCDCGETEYLVNLSNPKDGKVYYQEFDIEHASNGTDQGTTL